MIESAVFCLAINIYHEARGEPLEGQYAVALVTLNRAEHNLTNVCKVINKKAQFSWTLKRPFIHNPKAFELALTVARRAVSMQDFTNGATHYHSVKITPYWQNSMHFVGRWGNHLFYRK